MQMCNVQSYLVYKHCYKCDYKVPKITRLPQFSFWLLQTCIKPNQWFIMSLTALGIQVSGSATSPTVITKMFI